MLRVLVGGMIHQITALVRYAVNTEEAKARGDPHVALGCLPMFFSDCRS